jgi:3' terminal RNA ribose 2'-O-methyltransferase Hen1
VYLSIATTRQSATDLGFLLYKHPDRVFRSDASRNSKMSAVGFYPEAADERCEFCLIVEVDPVERVRGASWGAGIAQYVEPLPFLASSYMSQALSLCLRSAMNGIVTSKNASEEKRLQAAAVEKWPLEITVSPLRTSPALISRMFEPLGWDVSLHSVPLDIPGMTSEEARRCTDLHTLTIRGEATLQDALTHLYVLLPALDPARHYFYGEDEVQKLLDKSQNWLEQHPARELIVGRYLSKSRELRETALQQIAGDEDETAEDETATSEPGTAHDERHLKIIEIIRNAGDVSVVDLGCGEGKLLSRLAKLPGKLQITGVEPAMRDLEKAQRNLSRNPGKQVDPRIKLKHGSILYADEQLKGFDIAILSEVIEHIDPDRLDHAERCVFGFMQPRKVVVTTPNASFNAMFDLEEGQFRHRDHRFEWTESEARTWSDRICRDYGYSCELGGAGGYDPECGHLSHFIVFEKALEA